MGEFLIFLGVVGISLTIAWACLVLLLKVME